MTNPFEPPSSDEADSIGTSRRRYSGRQWVRAIIIFIVVTPPACAVTTFFVLAIGGTVLEIGESWLAPNHWAWGQSRIVVVIVGVLLGLRTSFRTARATFPLDTEFDDATGE